MLDVQQVRLRFIFVRALYPVSLFSKGLRKGFTGEAATEINTQRIRTDTDVRGSIQQRVCAANTLVKNVQGCTFFTVPPLYFYSRLVISKRTGMSVKLSSSEFAPQTRRWTVYTEVHCSTGYLQKACMFFSKWKGMHRKVGGRLIRAQTVHPRVVRLR